MSVYSYSIGLLPRETWRSHDIGTELDAELAPELAEIPTVMQISEFKAEEKQSATVEHPLSDDVHRLRDHPRVQWGCNQEPGCFPKG